MEIVPLYIQELPEANQMDSSTAFTVIIPAYNEAGRIRPVLEELCAFISERGVPWKVIVMVDGDDGTASIVSTFKKRFPFVNYVKSLGRTGKGSAIRRAVDLINTEFVILMDADNSVSLENILRNVHFLNKSDVFILSRYDSKMNDIPPFRRVISRGFNLAIRILLDLRIRDTQSGYKMFRTPMFKDSIARVTTTNTFFDVALLYYLNKSESRILEIPVEYKHNIGSTFHPIGEIIGQGVSLVAFRVRHTKMFDYIPRAITNLYYRKFRRM